ncbi:protein RepA [Salmonella enterica]|nr:protein RepA [Salmonella enterica]EEX1005973.1 protein RepA [Escherichia coli]
MEEEDKTLYFNDSLAVEDEASQKALTVTSTSSVQPVALLRLGIFVPNSRNVKKGTVQIVDVSSTFSSLSFARSEGYDDIHIRGERLNITTDFGVWMGTIAAFSKYGLTTNKITLPFKEFAYLCQYESRQINHRLRERIFESLSKLGTKVVQFKRKNGEKKFFTQLLKTAEMDIKGDTVTLEADEKLWELYKMDYTILLRKQPYNELKGKEVAQTLYAYIASLPDKPAPITFTRIRDRLMLTSPNYEQNRLIKAALVELGKIGYIEYSVVKKGNENVLFIHARHKKLKPLPE